MVLITTFVFYAPVLDLKIFNTSLMTANDTPIPSITNANVPNVVNPPLPELAVASQNKAVNPSKNSLARSLINPNPSLMALIIALPIIFPPYIYNFKLLYI